MIKPYEVTEFCNFHNICVEELLFLHRIYTKQKNHKIEVNFNLASELYQKNNKDTIEFKKLVKLLEQKGFLINENETDKILIKNLKVSDKFIEAIFINKDIALQEALEVYPHYMFIDGKEFQAKTCKEGREYLEEEYYKTIKGGDRIEHNRFIELNRINFENKKYATEKFLTWIKNWQTVATIIEENIQKGVKLQATGGNNRR